MKQHVLAHLSLGRHEDVVEVIGQAGREHHVLFGRRDNAHRKEPSLSHAPVLPKSSAIVRPTQDEKPPQSQHENAISLAQST